MNGENFGQRLKRLRLASGLGVRELARRAGIASHASISQAEKGLGWTRTPGPDVTKPLAKALGVAHAVLLGDAPSAGQIRRLTDADLFERFGVKPYDQPLSADGVAMGAGASRGVVPHDGWARGMTQPVCNRAPPVRGCRLPAQFPARRGLKAGVGLGVGRV